MNISLDFETFSACDLKKCGSYVYAQHPSTRVLCMQYSIDGGASQLWLPDQTVPLWLSAPEQFPGLTFTAWNCEFEQNIIEYTMRCPLAPSEQWFDTMAIAGSNSLPQALGICAQAMNMPDALAKDKRGKRLLQLLSKSQKKSTALDGEYDKPDRADLLSELYDYCGQDVVAEQAVGKLLPPHSTDVRAQWIVNNRINRRGAPIDTMNARYAVTIASAEVSVLRQRMIELSGDTIDNPNSTAQLSAWFHDNGLTLPNLQADTVALRIEMQERIDNGDVEPRDKPIPPDTYQMLKLRQVINKSSVSKYAGMLARSSAVNIMQGVHRFAGAHTGRYASTGINTQNMPRPKLYKKGDNNYANEPIKYFCVGSGSLLTSRYELPVMDVLSGAVRGHIKAPAGYRLIDVDYSAIEARITAWLAGAEKLLKVFREGGDPYITQASTMFAIPEMNVPEKQRLIGKVAILALGFAGGVGAFKSMAANYQLRDVSDADAARYRDAYRSSNPEIVRLWHDIEKAAHRAVARPGTRYKVTHNLSFYCHSEPHVLEMILPSGRRLHYWAPRVVPGERFGNPTLSYLGVDGVTKRWMRMEAWYGVLTENAVQAIAADLLGHALVGAEAAGYPVILHIHDQIVACAKEGFGSVEDLASIMCDSPAWAEGLPLAAEGHECERFRK